MPAPKDPLKRQDWLDKNSKAHKGKPSPNKGKKFHADWRKNLSIAHKSLKPSQKQLEALRAYSSGEKNFNYIDGRSKNKKWRTWIKTKNYRLKRACRFSTQGNHTFGEFETLKAQYDWTCPRCGKKEPEISLSRDHIIPLSKGGSDNIENIQPLCLPCNMWKHTKIIKFNKSI